jgi:cytidylate kinase
MYRIITIEREYGCGGGEIAAELAQHLGWKLWDRELTAEIARKANVDPETVKSCEERVDSTFHRLARVFWRGSFERSTDLAPITTFDTDRMVTLVGEVLGDVADQGRSVFVGRGAPYLLRDRADAFHVFLYAPRAEKMRRVLQLGKSGKEANELLDTIDRDRIAFIKHYFNADWPTRSLYHLMINTAIGNERVISTILYTMHSLETPSGAK